MGRVYAENRSNTQKLLGVKGLNVLFNLTLQDYGGYDLYKKGVTKKKKRYYEVKHKVSGTSQKNELCPLSHFGLKHYSVLELKMGRDGQDELAGKR